MGSRTAASRCRAHRIRSGCPALEDEDAASDKGELLRSKFRHAAVASSQRNKQLPDSCERSFFLLNSRRPCERAKDMPRRTRSNASARGVLSPYGRKRPTPTRSGATMGMYIYRERDRERHATLTRCSACMSLRQKGLTARTRCSASARGTLMQRRALTLSSEGAPLRGASRPLSIVREARCLIKMARATTRTGGHAFTLWTLRPYSYTLKCQYRDVVKGLFASIKIGPFTRVLHR